MRIEKLFSLFLIQNICCVYSKETSRLDGSSEHPKHTFKLADKKIIAIVRKYNLLNWAYGLTCQPRHVFSNFFAQNLANLETMSWLCVFIFQNLNCSSSSQTDRLALVSLSLRCSSFDKYHISSDTNFNMQPCQPYMSRDTRFPLIWYLRPAKHQISLRVRAF